MADRRAAVTGRPLAAAEDDTTLADAYAAGRLHDVEERLIVRFCPPLRPEEVQRHLVDVIGSFEDAPVRTYLPILVERATARRLEDVLAGRPANRRMRCPDPDGSAGPTLVASVGGA
jgi:hypothetical protein